MADHQPFIRHCLTGEVAPASRSRLVVYCHYDADNLLAGYVLHAIRALAAAGGEILFITNSTAMPPERLQPLLPYVREVIIRENRGYDFGAYYTGLMEAGDWERYQQIMLTNDSAYGPFYPLEGIFDSMRERGFDAWALTDGIAHRYYLQSWFQVWENRNGLFASLRRFWDAFTFEDDKEKVIQRYELGLSQFLLQKGFRLGAFCPQEEALARRDGWLAGDETYRRLNEATAQHLARRKRLKLLNLLPVTALARQWRFYDYWQRGVAIPQYSLWYPLVAYMHCPYIKVTLLKDPKLLLHHQFAYLALLERLYPEYDRELIQQHLHRIRALHLPKGL